MKMKINETEYPISMPEESFESTQSIHNGDSRNSGSAQSINV